ncbi:TPA: low specificity L-threonine aldolase [Streptococcus suis]
MLYFQNDYLQGAHPKILQALIDTNLVPQPGYTSDEYSQEAAQKIKEACQAPDAHVFLLSGGTQTNKIVIASMLQSYQGVLAPESGHISVHEAGAIEASGHKVLTLAHKKGKITASQVSNYIENFYRDGNHSHMVYPGMVYISHPTEYGTLYSKEELSALSQVCRHYQIPLFLDGARLIYGLAADETDLDLASIADLTDVFYIGGTKAGTLLGEALVFKDSALPDHFVTRSKQFGALLAKSRLLGVQFKTLFSDQLYLEIGRHAIEKAQKLRRILTDKGYPLYMDNPTNQVFVILTPQAYHDLKDKVAVSYWDKNEKGQIIVRFATSWSTSDLDLQALDQVLPTYIG